MKFRTKIVLGFGAALLTLAGIAVLSYHSFVHDEEDRKWVAHTHQVMEKLDNVLTDLVDAETGVRGFIITGDEEYLQPYHEGISRIDQDVRDVRSLTADNASQQLAMDRFEVVMHVRLEQLIQRIERRRQGVLPAPVMPLLKTGKHTMDTLRLQLGDMRMEEQQLLQERSNSVKRYSTRTRILLITGNSLALIFLTFAGFVVHKEMAARSKAQSVIEELNTGLELRVQERTAELLAREQDLSRSNAELKEREQDLSRSNSELQQFAYVASHDLQEPLRMVASFTQLLARRYKDKLDKDAHEFINFAVDGATRMQTLISDLLTYSRVGTQMKPFEPVSCEKILEQILRSLRLAIADNHADITWDPLPELMADGMQIGQLFQNLIANAIKFHGKDAPRIHIGAVETETGWKFSVRDNGIGIHEEHTDRIFVIFQRLHTKVEYPGTGIGLAICKKIAERHGGRIWIEPTPGGGSTFCFTISTSPIEPTKLMQGESDVHGIHARSN